MFRSARLKLTLFYLAIFALFSLTVTGGLRLLAEYEYDRSNDAQLNSVTRYWRLLPHPSGKLDVVFQDTQDDEAALVRRHLNHWLLLINLGALVVGGALSYWFAGRTLKPIQEAHEAQKRFTADASHELRTPLANMKLENEVFLRTPHFTEEEAREQLTSNLEEVQRLEKLSNNLLALTQFGNARLDREPIQITKITDAAVRRIKKTAETRGIEIKKDVARAKVLVHADSIGQMLDILLDNAVKHGSKGKFIGVSGAKQGDKYALKVQDKGAGIAAHDLPFIFDRLYRGDKARSSKNGGYGLGLALAREIAHANDGEITAANNPDGGAIFTVTLPLDTAKGQA